MSIGKVVNPDPDSTIPDSGGEDAVVLGAGAQDQHLGGRLAQQPDEVVAGEARSPPVALAGTTTRSKVSLARAGARARGGRSGRARSGRRPATPWAAGALFDRLQHRHRLSPPRSGSRTPAAGCFGTCGQVGGHQGRVLGPGQAQRRVERAARDLGAGEGQQDLVDRVGALGALAARRRERAIR